MSRDLTHEIRLRQLRDHAAANGITWTEPEPVKSPDSRDYTRQEIERILLDPEERYRAERIRAEYARKLEETNPQPRS